MEQPKDRTRVPVLQVLGGEPQHRSVKQADVAQLAFLGALALVMDNLGLRRIKNLPPGLLDAVAPVQVFAIHEVTLVEQTSPVALGTGIYCVSRLCLVSNFELRISNFLVGVFAFGSEGRGLFVRKV